MGGINYMSSSSITSSHRRNQVFSVIKTTTILLMLLTPMMNRETTCESICQRITSNLFRSRIGIVNVSIEVRCCIVYIHNESFISDMVTKSTIEDQSQLVWKKVLGVLLPKLVKRYVNRTFIFLLLMEDNPKKRLQVAMMVFSSFWALAYTGEILQTRSRRLVAIMKEEFFRSQFLIPNVWYGILENRESSLKSWRSPWRRRRFKAKEASSVWYGDILKIVEDWQSQILFLPEGSIHWILNGRTSLDLIGSWPMFYHRGD